MKASKIFQPGAGSLHSLPFCMMMAFYKRILFFFFLSVREVFIVSFSLTHELYNTAHSA